MLNKWTEYFLTRRTMVVFGFAAFLVAGIFAFLRLNIEAYPNPAPTILEISAQAPGQSAEEMERYSTIPIEVGIATTPGLEHLRSISLYGLTFVRAQFQYGVDYFFALQQTLNRLGNVVLPNGVTANINPSSLVGEVYRYQLVGPPGMSAMDLRTLNDWVVGRRFKTVPGVDGVVNWGGPTREYHVEVDLNKLPSYHLTMAQVISAIGNANINVGGRTLNVGQQSVDVRGIGLIKTTDDIDSIVVAQANGIPVLVKDIGKSVVGFTPRQGIAGKDGQDDVVLGIVIMRRTEKTSEVVEAIKKEADNINARYLPKDVHLVPYYDRAHLVSLTTETVLHNLIVGVCLVFLVQYLFLGNLRSAIIVAATIPFALFFAVIILVLSGESANLLSIGAVDFGIIVDSTVIMVENIFRSLRAGTDLEEIEEPSQSREAVLTALRGKLSKILGASVEVNASIMFAVLVTVAAFVPLFTMQGIEGQIFGPMARTYGFALLGALICTFTVSPALSALLLPEETKETETFVVRGIRKLHMPSLRWAMKHRAISMASAVALLAVSVGFMAPRLGTEFLPHLEEGNLWIRVALPPTISLQAGMPVVAKIRQILKSYPEVVTVVSQHGRPDDGTDAAPLSNAEFFAPLTPESEWPGGMTKDKLIADMQANLERQFVGTTVAFSQYIQDNIEEAVSGVKGANSVKLFGPDLDVLDSKINEIKDQLVQVRGITDVGIFKEVGKPNLVIEVDRAKAARYGLQTGDVNAVISSAIAGAQATTVFEGEKQFALIVRLDPKFRASIDDIKNIHVANVNTGGDPAYVPLSALANISLQSGAAYIYREASARFVPMKFGVRGRSLGAAVAEAQDRVEKNVRLPEGYYVEWSGEFGAYLEAQKRLAIIVPLSLVLILVLLYALFNSVRHALLALSGLPFAMCGGIIALYVTGQHFSVSSAVGFVTGFGINAMNGILLMHYYNLLHARGLDGKEAMTQAARLRMRAMLMTAMSAAIGLLPAALSNGIGAQVQRPLATVVVGSMLFVPIMNLVVMPVICTFFLPAPGGKQPAEAP